MLRPCCYYRWLLLHNRHDLLHVFQFFSGVFGARCFKFDFIILVLVLALALSLVMIKETIVGCFGPWIKTLLISDLLAKVDVTAGMSSSI